jgi:glycosyltransferase involved in cell wall biosynthesis
MTESQTRNILVTTNKLLPYSETFIKNHVEGLHGFQSMILASELLSHGIQVKCNSIVIIKDLTFGSVQDVLYKMGFILPSMISFLKSHDFKLIHSHFGQNGHASVELASRLKIPHVTTFHGLDITLNSVSPKHHGRLLKRFHDNFEKLQTRGDLFIAVSNFIRDKLIEKGFSKDKIVTNYIGIDTKYFKPPANDSKREKVIICVARHVEYKGICYLIDAMAKINAIYPEWKLLLIGDGILTESLKLRAMNSNINVEFAGRLAPSQIRQELSTAKIYCQPSIRLENGHEEALALTIVEAQAMGLPAVVFNTGGMPEAINPNKSGFVVEEKNVAELADRILILIENDNVWNEFSKAAVIYANTNHCFFEQIVKLENLYNDLIGRP